MEKVCILMSTYNGEKYLSEQIESIFRQEKVDFQLLIRDDGSCDRTVDIIKHYQDIYGKNKIEYYSGDNIGFIKSFLTLIKICENFEYYALCDQDDVWDSDKLFCAIEQIKKAGKDAPILYYSNLNIVDESLKFCRVSHSKVHYQNNKFSALTEDMATGCTMVFNSRLMDVLRKGNPDSVSCHDSWIHLIAKFFGVTIYDFTPHISYRQHSQNSIGAYKKITPKVVIEQFARKVKRFSFARSNNAKELLHCYGDMLSHDDKRYINIFINYNKNIWTKLRLLMSIRIHSTSIFRECIYWFLIIRGRL